MSEPKRVIAGDTVSWTRPGGDYPSDDGWSLIYYFASPAAALDPVAATPDGAGNWEINLSASETKSWGAAIYRWQAKASRGAENYTVATGELQVDPSLDDLERYDPRGYAERTLEAIEALLCDKATGDEQNYSVGGRSVTTYTPAELLEWRDKLRSEVAQLKRAERIQRGEGRGGRILVRMR